MGGKLTLRPLQIFFKFSEERFVDFVSLEKDSKSWKVFIIHKKKSQTWGNK